MNIGISNWLNRRFKLT